MEDRLANNDESISEKADKVVEKAITASISSFRQKLTDQLLEGQSEVSKKIGEDMEALANRLKRHVGRSRGNQEMDVNQLVKFQEEIRVAVVNLQGSQNPLVRPTV